MTTDTKSQSSPAESHRPDFLSKWIEELREALEKEQ